MATLNIEEPAALLRYLRDTGHVPLGEKPAMQCLSGGVSNRTVLVQRTDGTSFVIKQALEKLRVQVDWRSDPRRSHLEALGLEWLARLAPSGSITPILFEDAEQNLVAMAAVPPPHENWKTRLLAGLVEMPYVRQFGELLGTIHRRAQEFREELAAAFDDRTFFETLRVEPYYSFTASRNPASAPFFSQLISETRATRQTLVHGDYSPKNILIHQDALILLDHEVVHWGDPAFDLGFSLTHLLSKAHHLALNRTAFLNAAKLYWEHYLRTAGEPTMQSGFETRVVRHTLGCLLARIDGRSPLEYLTAAERLQQRASVLTLIEDPPVAILELLQKFENTLCSPSKS